MKVVCINTDLSRTSGIMIISGEVIELQFGKVYESKFVMHDGETGKPLEWDKNLLTLEGFSELDWFPTENFVTLDVWRQKILDDIL